MSDPKEGNAWHADHIVAVFQGGGNFGFYGVYYLTFYISFSRKEVLRRW